MLQKIDDLVWGIPMIVLILAVGIFLTIRLRPPHNCAITNSSLSLLSHRLAASSKKRSHNNTDDTSRIHLIFL